ncbi:nucleolar protein 14 [Pilobolus umbonatus]|nr:nucleolar protein 14 [Pilobolus umbonatus]
MVSTKQNGAPKGGGGSALKRLKKSLQTAGIIGQTSKASRSKKDRKKGLPTEVGKNKDDRKLNVIRGEFNPFEKKVQNTKFEILGRKMKGVSGKPTLSKQIGEENRKKTLLMEMKNKNRRGGIVDKRFGENNTNMSLEEKMLVRFTKEKQKSAKGSMFNLDDDEDLSLTHYGQSLSTMDDFDDAGLGLSDDEEPTQMDKSIVSKMHFGGFEDEEQGEERHKSKSEVMKEIIAKSKMYKLERQSAKQEDDDLREALDDELGDIRGLLEMKPRKPLPSQTSIFKRSENENSKDKEEKGLNDYSDYDRAVRELAMDHRAVASDRTKTEEEIALEEKEKLEKAERARKRRMEGLDSDDEEEDSKRKHHKKRRGAPQADDLDDDFLEELDEDVARLGKGLTLEDIQNAHNKHDSEEEGSEDGEDESEGDEDESGEDSEGEEYESEEDNEDLEEEDEEDMLDMSDDEDDMNDFGKNGIVRKSKTPQPVKEEKREVPYTFECPTTHEELLSILKGLEVEDSMIVTKRIRVLYHIKLAPENKAKLSAFLGVLVEHIAYIASTVNPLPTNVLDNLGLHVFELCQQLPETAADVFTQRLEKMLSEMAKKLKYSGSSWPDTEDLTLLRIIGQVFSTSDLTHPIATPAILYMCQALNQCPIQSQSDIGRGLFLALICLEYQKIAKRYIPEVLNFLNRMIILLSPSDTFEGNIPGYFPMPEMKHKFNITDIKGDESEIPSLKLEQLSNGEDSPFDDLSLFLAVIRMVERYLQMYSSITALKEVFEPTLEIILMVNKLSWHEDIKTALNTLQDRLERQIRFCVEKRIKTPLRLQQHRPIPIAQHLPKFEKAYSVDHHYDPDHERSQLHKLESQLKKEKKGAMRELRKDNQFIAREVAKQRKEKDAEYNKMVKGVMHLLEGEQSEQKQLEREKNKR